MGLKFNFSFIDELWNELKEFFINLINTFEKNNGLKNYKELKSFQRDETIIKLATETLK